MTIVDRKSRFIIAKKLENRLSENVLEMLLKTLKQEKVYSLTSDRGNEFYHFRAVGTALNIQYYFANSYCSWQRGTNENANGLIREFFPKTDFANVSEEQLCLAINLINNHARKCLGWKTAKQVYENNLPIPKQNLLK